MKNFERFMALPLGNILRFSASSPHHSEARAKPANPEARGEVIGVLYVEIPGSRFARPE